jgi:hypothetical protein
MKMPGHVTEVLTPLLELHWDEHTNTKLPAKQHSKTTSAPGKWRGGSTVDPGPATATGFDIAAGSLSNKHDVGYAWVLPLHSGKVERKVSTSCSTPGRVDKSARWQAFHISFSILGSGICRSFGAMVKCHTFDLTARDACTAHCSSTVLNHTTSVPTGVSTSKTRVYSARPIEKNQAAADKEDLTSLLHTMLTSWNWINLHCRLVLVQYVSITWRRLVLKN